MHQTLGEVIKELRVQVGLTHEELADRLDMSFQRISELERGIANPTFATLVRVVEGFEIELSELSVRLERVRDWSKSPAQAPVLALSQLGQMGV